MRSTAWSDRGSSGGNIARLEASLAKYSVIFDEDMTTILTLYVGRRATTTYKSN